MMDGIIGFDKIASGTMFGFCFLPFCSGCLSDTVGLSTEKFSFLHHLITGTGIDDSLLPVNSRSLLLSVNNSSWIARKVTNSSFKFEN